MNAAYLYKLHRSIAIKTQPLIFEPAVRKETLTCLKKPLPGFQSQIHCLLIVLALRISFNFSEITSLLGELTTLNLQGCFRIHSFNR